MTLSWNWLEIIRLFIVLIICKIFRLNNQSLDAGWRVMYHNVKMYDQKIVNIDEGLNL